MTEVAAEQSPPWLPGSDEPLICRHRGLLLDLDGVCYVGDEPVAGAASALASARDAGLAVRFMTNNASKPPAAVAGKLNRLGFAASIDEVVTSATCAARILAEELEPGSRVLVVGGEGVVDALIEAGLEPVRSADDNPAAVVQGWDPDVGWRQLAEAALALGAGARWIATNLDRTIPNERGILPGNGSLVTALRVATGLDPRSIGKPEPTMYVDSARGLECPLAVGDRLDTDIAGAIRAGFPSLLVLTGVTSPTDLLLAPIGQRPTHVAADLSGLAALQPPAVLAGETRWQCREAWAEVGDGRLALGGDRGPDRLDRVRAACAAAWVAADAGGAMDCQQLRSLDL